RSGPRIGRRHGATIHSIRAAATSDRLATALDAGRRTRLGVVLLNAALDPAADERTRRGADGRAEVAVADLASDRAADDGAGRGPADPVLILRRFGNGYLFVPASLSRRR